MADQAGSFQKDTRRKKETRREKGVWGQRGKGRGTAVQEGCIKKAISGRHRFQAIRTLWVGGGGVWVKDWHLGRSGKKPGGKKRFDKISVKRSKTEPSEKNREEA